jgi:Fe-S cluster assembly protein SufD
VSGLAAARDRWVSVLEARRESLGPEPAWLATLRRAALARFAAMGFPSTRLEAWRYTPVEPIARLAPESPPQAELSRDRLEAIAVPVFACSLFVFVNGRFAPRLSSPAGSPTGLRVESLARLRREAPERLEPHLGRREAALEQPFAALNTACFEDGALVSVPAGARVETPVHLVFVSAPNGAAAVSTPRVLVVAGPGSRATLIQDHVSLGDGAAATLAVSEVELGPGASLELVLLQRESDRTHHVANLCVEQARDSRLASHTLSLSGALVRNDLATRLAGPGAEARLRGLFVGAREEILDNHTLVDHALPRGTSDELYKGILAGRSRGVFRGRVVVRPDAQKSDARQSNPNVLLGLGAEVDTRPQLEIHADDVRCSHGSSIGRLDPEALFYLRSRGFAEGVARELLMRGFAHEILDALPAPAFGECVGERLVERLRGAALAGDPAAAGGPA